MLDQPPHPYAPPDAIFDLSPSMRPVMDRIAEATASRAGVVVIGERGTGRRAVARAIHRASADTMPFIEVDCAAFDARDLVTVFLGPGSETWPVARRGLESLSRSALFYRAIGGTLFIRNVCEMCNALQRRLIKLLRDHEALLIEDRRRVDADVRTIVAVDARCDLADRDGEILPELARRLGEIRIDLPPLRQRKEDIPALCRLFLDDVCRARRLPAKKLTDQTLLILAELPWRDNAWELRNVIESLALRVNGPVIRLRDLLGVVRFDGGTARSMTGMTLRDARRRFEREFITAVLEQHRGRVPEAARALGIQRTNLYRKLRGLHVVRTRPSGATPAGAKLIQKKQPRLDPRDELANS